MVNNVASLSFQYYYYDPVVEAYLWEGVWTEEEEKEEKIPQAVRIKIELGEDAEREKVSRTIAIPVAKYPRKKYP